MKSRRGILRLILGRKSSFPFAIRRLFQFQSITRRVRNCTIDTGRFAVLKKSGRTSKKWRIEAARYGSESGRGYSFRFFSLWPLSRGQSSLYLIIKMTFQRIEYTNSLELYCFKFNAAAHSVFF